MFDRDYGDFVRLLREVLPRLGPRGGTSLFSVRLSATMDSIRYRGNLPLQFRIAAIEY
jgi:hypothetical protein